MGGRRCQSRELKSALSRALHWATCPFVEKWPWGSKLLQTAHATHVRFINNKHAAFSYGTVMLFIPLQLQTACEQEQQPLCPQSCLSLHGKEASRAHLCWNFTSVLLGGYLRVFPLWTCEIILLVEDEEKWTPNLREMWGRGSRKGSVTDCSPCHYRPHITRSLSQN